MQTEEQERLYCQHLLNALAARPESTATQTLKPGTTRNAARFTMNLLCERLGAAGAVELVERTTIRWRDGLVNMRHAVNTEFWTNLTSSTVERMETLSGVHPAAFVLMCWSSEAAEFHVWAIPGSMIRDGLSAFNLSANGQYRMVRIVPGRNRFEGFTNSPDLTPLYRRLTWNDGELTQLRPAIQADQAERTRYDDAGVTADIISIAQRYHSNRVVFRSPEKGARYLVSGVDEKGCVVQRVGGDPARLTWSNYRKKYAALQKSGSFARRSQLDATVAIHMMMLQGSSIVTAAEGAGVRLLSSRADTLEYLQTRLEIVCQPQILRAGTLLAVVDAMNSRELTENSISPADLLTWVQRVCNRSGVVAGPDEIVRAVAHLADVGLMLFVQNDVNADASEFMRTRSLFLAAVPNVILHSVLWTVLSSSSDRQELSNTLHDIAGVFVDSERTFESSGTLQEGISQLIDSISRTGFVYQPWQIACYVTALRTKPFVILAGVSGTGKTKLPRLIATLSGASEPVRVAVRPDWTDSSDILGYVDLQHQFRPGLVLQQLRRASSDVMSFHTCILDEMNLARVEHYLAEYLSAVEECVPCPGGGFQSTSLLAYIAGEDNAEWATQVLPPNFAVVGTVNMDETTQAFSRKVLDRAFTIELSDIDLQMMGLIDAAKCDAELQRWPVSWWTARYRRISDVSEECRGFDSILDRVIRVLTLANTVLIHAQMQLGYRTRDEIALFMLNAADVQESFRTLGGEAVDPLDLALMMKVLPRLVGSSQLMRQILAGLIDLAQTGISADADTDASPTVVRWESLGQQAAFRGAAFPYTLARLCLMHQRLEREGYTSFWL